MDTDTDAVILIVDDNRSLADLYTEWLSDSYTVKTAYGGEDALIQFDASVDIVLLDRRMPDLAGDQVLATIREREFDCQVALVTSVAMNYDSLPLEFDDYLRKPATKRSLRMLVESLRIRREYSEKLQEYFALVSKRVALQTEKDGDEFANHPQVCELDDRIADLKQEIDKLLSDFSDADYRAVFTSIFSEDGFDTVTHGLG